MNLKQGDIVGFSGNHFISRLIQRATSSKWNHVAMIYEVNHTHIVYVEAKGKNRLVKLSKKKLQRKIDREKICTRRVKRAITSPESVIDSHLGGDYAESQIGLFLFKIWSGLSMKWYKSKKDICTELVEKITKTMTSGKVSFAREYNATKEFITPEQMVNSTQVMKIYN